MDFFKELIGTNELFSFFQKIAGTPPMIYDFLILVLGTYLLQRILRGMATFFLIFSMTIFAILIHYNASHTLYEAIIKAYNAKGIAFFRQEIFLGIIVFFFTFSSRFTEEDDFSSFSQVLPVFIIVESINILQAVGNKTVSDQFPFWAILIFMLMYIGVSSQVDTDHKIEEKILNGNASDSDHAYWVKRKREKEREEQWQQQQYDNNDNHF